MANQRRIIPLLVLYDLLNERYVIPARDGGYLKLDGNFADRLVQEGVLEQLKGNAEAIIYGVTPNMTSVDLRLELSRELVRSIIADWLVSAIDFDALSCEHLKVDVEDSDLPPALSVQWSVLGVVPHEVSSENDL